MRNGFGEIILRNMSKSGPVLVLIICHDVHVSWMYREQDAVNDSLQELFHLILKFSPPCTVFP